MDPSFDIFLSHSRADKRAAIQLAARWQAFGFAVFADFMDDVLLKLAEENRSGHGKAREESKHGGPPGCHFKELVRAPLELRGATANEYNKDSNGMTSIPGSSSTGNLWKWW
jgi:hypothetical protein